MSKQVDFESESIAVEIDGHVATIKLNRPRKSNAINEDLLYSYEKALEFVVSSGARCVILAGNGKNFCGGLDLQVISLRIHYSTCLDECRCSVRFWGI